MLFSKKGIISHDAPSQSQPAHSDGIEVKLYDHLVVVRTIISLPGIARLAAERRLRGADSR